MIVQEHSRNAGRPRMVWMDMIRGTAILLVVILHSNTMLPQYFKINESAAVDWFNDLFSSYRIPTLIFLSGFLMPGSLGKSPGHYLAGKVRRILWPLVIWATIFAFLICRLQPTAMVIYNAIFGASYLWYMLFIFIYYCVSLFLKSISPIYLFVIAITLSFASPDGTKYYERLFYLYSVFCLGWLAACHKDRFLRLIDSRWPLIAIPFVVGFSFIAAEYDLSYDPRSIVPALAFVLVSARLFRAVDGQSRLRWLSYIGRNSLIFYTTHVPAMFVAMWVLTKSGVTSPISIGAVSLVVALAASTTLAYAAGRWQLVKLAFELPAVGARRTATSARTN